MRLIPLRSLQFALATLAVLAVTATSATAQTHPAVAPTNRVSMAPDAQPYSAGIALATPLLLSAASAGVIVVGAESDTAIYAGVIGLLVSPSLGHVYTGDWRGVLIGGGLRLAGTGLVVVGVASAVGNSFGAVDDNDEDDSTNLAGLAILGSLAITAGTLYSIVDAPYSAKRANKQHSAISLSPAPIQGPDKSTGWGTVFQATF
tara:strand:- start:105166 stop:105777 length:612 start_codon:yes stop_codon:yes gene_type:complete